MIRSARQLGERGNGADEQQHDHAGDAKSIYPPPRIYVLICTRHDRLHAEVAKQQEGGRRAPQEEIVVCAVFV